VGNRRLLHKQKSVSYRRILNIFSVNVNTFQVASFPMKEMKFLVGGVPANDSHGKRNDLYPGKVSPTLKYKDHICNIRLRRVGFFFGKKAAV
jgi:hypothetical protein